MAGEKMTAGQSDAARKSGRQTAIKRQADGGKVSSYAGVKTAGNGTAKGKQPVNAAEIALAKGKAEAAAKLAAEAAKAKEAERKKKEDEDYKKRNSAAKGKSAIDIAMGR
jgi:hypothetical protein